MTKMITKGRANARMKVEIGLRTQMSSKFLRTKAQICLRSKFMVLVLSDEAGNEKENGRKASVYDMSYQIYAPRSNERISLRARRQQKIARSQFCNEGG